MWQNSGYGSCPHIDTGKLAWHFQYTPNDSWDYDET